ncbi:hypothetical protein I7I50_08377 [Histoplasma capsulatum G186AR]|uniref:Uncharacterized protein n=1 Tax=Ajellomyces capsulatus TaxID=5037 RepID=A0A8H7YNF6_AJECA|nr:hypothetical protein I7I52_05893 [Histoplasma capsulatum]QSS73565.1 hypothetical protein I7I50_08377 [Histoplasma capsulatum G186AR]
MITDDSHERAKYGKLCLFPLPLDSFFRFFRDAGDFSSSLPTLVWKTPRELGERERLRQKTTEVSLIESPENAATASCSALGHLRGLTSTFGPGGLWVMRGWIRGSRRRSAKILTASVELTAIVAALFLGPELDSWQCTRGRRLATIMG